MYPFSGIREKEGGTVAPLPASAMPTDHFPEKAASGAPGAPRICRFLAIGLAVFHQERNPSTRSRAPGKREGSPPRPPPLFRPPDRRKVDRHRFGLPAQF